MRPRPVPADEVCADLNGELWFDRGKFSKRRAKQICATCPAYRRCRDGALAETKRLMHAQRMDLDGGIFGGLTVEERISLVNHRHSTVGQPGREDTDG